MIKNPILPGCNPDLCICQNSKLRYYNLESRLQKSGHVSYIDLPNGETWMVHLTARSFVQELCCTL